MRLQAVASAAQFGRGARGELVAGGQEDLGAEALEQRAPGLVAWQRRPQGADALRRDDRNQPRLAGQRERALVAGRVGLADRGERVVLVADEEQVAPRRARAAPRSAGCAEGRRAGNRASACTPSARARPGFIATGKFSASTWPLSSSSSSGGSGRGSPGLRRAGVGTRGGQNARWTAGLSSNSDRNTTMPSMIEERRRVRGGSSRACTSARPPRADAGGPSTPRPAARRTTEWHTLLGQVTFRARHRTGAPCRPVVFGDQCDPRRVPAQCR